MQALRDVVLLVGFGLALSAILGIQLFQGLLKHRCFEPGADAPLDADAGVCAVEPPGRACPAGLECRAWDANPLAGTVGFDNFAEAAMTTFQCVTLEGWSEVMYMLQAAAGRPEGAAFCVCLVIRATIPPRSPCPLRWHHHQCPDPSCCR